MTLASLLLVPLLATAAPSLRTIAEESGDLRTGRYAEVESLCRELPRAFPGRVRCMEFGRTPEGRPMLALVASQDGALTPGAARRGSRTVVFAQGGIHAGEIEGKDAGLRLMREALAGKALPGVLSRVTWVFVPVLNVDGHERFGRNHRPNQTGPEEAGFRVTAQNLNLNRDFAKAEAPETRALLSLLKAWDPEVLLDLHATDGARFQPDVAVLVEPRLAGPPALAREAQGLQDALFARLTRQGHQPLEFYPSFRVSDQPSSGFAVAVSPPRFETSGWAMRNRLALLVETHSWRTYRERVQATVDVLAGVLTVAAERGTAWRAAMRAADARDATEPGARESGAEVVLEWRTPAAPTRTLDFPGHPYRYVDSPALGREVVRYDPTTPQVWKVPYWATVEPAVTVQLPRAGWVIPPAHAWVAEKLALHGFRTERLRKPLRDVDAERFTALGIAFGSAPYEGRQLLTVTGDWRPVRAELPAGSLYVPAAQPGRLLLAHLLEPVGKDSFLSWGFFNAHFEQKEYVEDYVLDLFAQELLARDPAVAREFRALLRDDPAFAADPKARARFFLRLHPARDVRENVYPILRVARPPRGG